jgi:hypothetical protein
MQILSSNGCFGTKSSKIAHTKTALGAKVANFEKMHFCFLSSKDKMKSVKLPHTKSTSNKRCKLF